MPRDRASARPSRSAAIGTCRTWPPAALAAIACLLLVAAARPAPASIPYAPVLARCYDAILDARFDDADAEIAKACGPAPPETCALMRVNALWWRIQMNPNDRSKDGAFQSQVDRVIEEVAQWTAREPGRADAWFFLGGAYGLRVQFRVLRAERLAAARDGKRIKEALERALALDPTLQDAYFGIGLYHYYAGMAPSILKILSWLLGLPGGNREQGLQEMWRARNRGELLRGEADFQLQLIDLWYEQKPVEALTLLEGLRASYPHNPIFLQSIADVEDVVPPRPRGEPRQVARALRAGARPSRRLSRDERGSRAPGDGRRVDRARQAGPGDRSLARRDRRQADGAVWGQCARVVEARRRVRPQGTARSRARRVPGGDRRGPAR